jgi:hypothetical protein
MPGMEAQRWSAEELLLRREQPGSNHRSTCSEMSSRLAQAVPTQFPQDRSQSLHLPLPLRRPDRLVLRKAYSDWTFLAVPKLLLPHAPLPQAPARKVLLVDLISSSLFSRSMHLSLQHRLLRPTGVPSGACSHHH